MMEQEQTEVEKLARTFGAVAREAFAATASYLQSLRDDEWNGPTACTRWTVRDLAGHVVGEAVWFPNLVRGATHGEAPYPGALYEELKVLPDAQLVDRLAGAADEIRSTIDGLTGEQMRLTVDLGFTRLPIWSATHISANEAVVHNWDARSGRDPATTIPARWAQVVALRGVELARLVMDRQAPRDAAGRYVLDVGDGVGPVSVVAEEGRVRVERSAAGEPDIVLHLSADQYIRLVEGRLDLDVALRVGEVVAEGDPGRATYLNRIFPGI